MEKTPQDRSVGKQLGAWTVAKPLAAGGMGSLYLAARPSPTRGVELGAVKQLQEHLCWDPEFVRMFLEEVRIASGLKHPNIVSVLDWGTGAGGHYFAMEYVHGQHLGQVLRMLDGQRLPLELAVGIVAELADGLHYAHEYRSADGSVQGLVHRDVSPSNAMIGYDGRVRLLDFGIARISGRTQHTRTGAFKGKIGYTSPEQIEGKHVDRRTDIFALGIILYELSVGRRAFYSGSDFGVVAKILEADYVAPTAVDPYYPPALQAIVERALRRQPEQRYGSAAELAVALRQYAVHCGINLDPQLRAHWMQSRFAAPPRPTVDLARLQRDVRAAERGRRRGRVRTVAAVAAGLALGAVGFVAGSIAGSEQESAATPSVADAEGAAAQSPSLVAPAPAPPPAESPDPNAVPSPAVGEGQAVLPEAPAQATDEAQPPAAVEPTDPEPDPVATKDGIVIEEPAAPRPRRRSRRRADKRPSAARSKGEDLLPPSWR